MKPRISLIGIITQELAADHWGTLKTVAGLGYEGIEIGAEFLSKLPVAPQEYRQRVAALGLRIINCHVHYRELETMQREPGAFAGRLQAVGCEFVTVSWLPCDSKAQILKDARQLDLAGAAIRPHGLTLCYHNHDHEFRQLDGQYGLNVLLANTDPANLQMQLDVGWVLYGGVNPAAYLLGLSGRCPLLHLKDFVELPPVGTDRKLAKFTETGTGVNDFCAIRQSAEKAGVKWASVEQDRPRELPPLESIRVSIEHLRKAGW